VLRHRILKYVFLAFASLCLVSIPLWPSLRVIATVSTVANASAHLEQGRTLYGAGRFSEAATLWQQAAQGYAAQGDHLNEALSWSYLSLAQQELNQWKDAQVSIEQSLKLLKSATPAADAILWAQALNTQASLQLHSGQAEMAIESWQQAQKFYEQADDTLGSLGSQINQAQALQSLGFYRRSRQQLEALTQQLANLPDSTIKVNGLRSLGSVLQRIGEAGESQKVLEQSLQVARQTQAKTDLSSILLTLGTTAVDLGDPTAGFSYFEQAEQEAASPGDQLQARLAQFKLLLDYNRPDLATPLAPQLLQQLQALPPSRTSLYAAINFVALLNRVENATQFLPLQDLSQLMATTVESAQQIQDAQAQAYALQQWGQLYQQTQQWSEAENLTEKSLNIARQLQAEDIIAQSAWRLGQLYNKQGKDSQAIATYTEAVSALKAIRGDLVAIDPNFQFSFRESVEPVYRELVELLLEDQPSQEALVQARELIESLQVAELDNFFRQACLDKVQQIDQVDPSATVIYPIILPDRLAVIISQTGKPLRYYVTEESRAEIEETLNQLLVSLHPVSDFKERNRLSQKVYNWLIQPAEVDQVFKDSKTLVFILDGRLRNIPMGALYDGEQYLVEKYAVALSPGLQLMAAQSFRQSQLRTILGGISESHLGFSALPEVESEVKQISKITPSSLLLNQDFTSYALAKQVKGSSASVVHLATHGQFSSRLEDTFLLTWDGQLNIQELSELLQSRGSDPSKAVELLVLSACDTAAGDERAVLGLAGLAVKSGARSTVATLWPVKDKAASLLMSRFYEQLQQPGISKAEALRQAQIGLMRETDFRDPFFWSAYVLVGNWQ
jgi:CHAT domain-containing protein